MRIITSRRLRFYSPDRQLNFVTSGNNIIEDCPDWAKEDGMFKAARASGVLQLISTKKEEKEAENDKVLAQNAHESKQLIESMNEVKMDEGEEVEDIADETYAKEEAKKEAKKAARKARKAAKKETE